jgi:RNA polymerase sigma-70 factor, ECF subfamily
MTDPARADFLARNDNDLVRMTLEGDKEAYRALVERYQGRLFTTALDIVKTREDAEDVVQETFVKAFLSLAQFRGQSSFYTWLYRICFNMAIDIRRKAGRRGGTHLEFKEHLGVNRSAVDDGARETGGPGVGHHTQRVEGPHDALARKELGRKIQEVLSKLSEEHRAVIVLREVDGLDYEEIAKAIGAPKGTVMSRLFYARKALQKALEEFAPELSAGTEVEDTILEGSPRSTRSGKAR